MKTLTVRVFDSWTELKKALIKVGWVSLTPEEAQHFAGREYDEVLVFARLDGKPPIYLAWCSQTYQGKIDRYTSQTTGLFKWKAAYFPNEIAICEKNLAVLLLDI